ncbi:hypothetical protein [Nostoc sp. LEGE 12450]|nr:hypothetical protein [Nostoc sp. LEGE 12450]MBE8986484.1 hypothetical protein [Nostoc sp. LEGE 12450]
MSDVYDYSAIALRQLLQDGDRTSYSKAKVKNKKKEYLYRKLFTHSKW